MSVEGGETDVPQPIVEAATEVPEQKTEVVAKTKSSLSSLRLDIGRSLGGFFGAVGTFVKLGTEVIRGFWGDTFSSSGSSESTVSEAKTEASQEPKKQKASESKEKHKGLFNEDLKALMAEFKIEDSGNSRLNFFNVAIHLGKEVQAKYGVPYQVVVAQARLESGFGLSGLSQTNFNCFGIKAQKGYKGDSSSWKTAEYFDGKTRTVINSSFRSYSSIRESFMDYGRLLSSSSRYQNAFDFASDPRQFLSRVLKSGYATDPNYLAKAESTIKKYGLDWA